MERIPVDWIMEVPPITRAYLLGVVGFSLMAYTGIVTRSDCYYTSELVFKKHEYYRLVSSFFYYGKISLDLLLTLFMISRYFKALEQTYARPIDFIWCVCLLASTLVLYSTFVENLYQLGPYLNETMLYIWARRNPEVEMTVLGLINFRAVYLPLISIVATRIAADGLQFKWKAEFAAIGVGHLFFYFNDIFPRVHSCESPLRPIWRWYEHAGNNQGTVDGNIDAAANEIPQNNDANDANNDLNNNENNNANINADIVNNLQDGDIAGADETNRAALVGAANGNIANGAEVIDPNGIRPRRPF